jgi:hypothetical protein
MSLPPRFPEPFVEELRRIAKWGDVLSLLSVDKREALSRVRFIALTARIDPNKCPDAAVADWFCSRFPTCAVAERDTSQEIYRSSTSKRVKPFITTLSWLASASEFACATLPRSLTRLTGLLDSSAIQSQSACLRELLVLDVRGRFEPAPGFELPAKLKVLALANFCTPISTFRWPTTLCELTLGALSQPLAQAQFPASLTSLVLNDFDEELENLPTNLHTLVLLSFNRNLRNVPANLRVLRLGDRFNQPLCAGVLPRTLKRLTLGDRFAQPIADGVLPDGLEVLHFGLAFSGPLSRRSLPPSLVAMSFPDHSQFRQSFAEIDLPPSLETLSLNSEGDEQIRGVTVPPGCHVKIAQREFRGLSMDDNYD